MGPTLAVAAKFNRVVDVDRFEIQKSQQCLQSSRLRL